MFALSMIGKHHMLFSKHATLKEAKEQAHKNFKDSEYDYYEQYNYAEIYNQENKETIRKYGVGREWMASEF